MYVCVCADVLSQGPELKGDVCKKVKWKHSGEGVHLRVDMPGLGKEDVKVSVKENIVSIKGAGKKEFEGDGKTGRGYSSMVYLSKKLYKMKEMKAEMKNGVLKVFVPKIKDEERTDVFDVSVVE
ncbi:heat shock 22 kDa protein mitochondrial [Phtheirospermum japonicum]|uniref:Heat shock 22 kDa protein mitochondrial n=1 Tax=Phtheirospermum japonicum TaxID=374723 RepID=A0A830BQL8_9LAMI|nr:heat shock 22 kDa protein mitochondrial [Phtheirospermum japonicum]